MIEAHEREALAKIPQELKDQSSWVVWRAEPKGNGKLTKIPVNPKTGQFASVTEPRTWGTYVEALRACLRSKEDGIRGLGFVFTAKDPFCGVDLDNSLSGDGKIDLQTQAYVDQLWSYTEITPSGRGLHVLLKGHLPGRGRKRGGIEIYNQGRFFTITGSHLSGTPIHIEHRQKELETFYHNVFGNEEKAERIETRELLLSDTEVLERAKRAKNGDKFMQLWKGDYSGYASQSEADLALCSVLAFWCGNNREQINRLFRQSGLYRRKWDEKHGATTYGEMTILKAVRDSKELFGSARGLPQEHVKTDILEMLDNNEVGDARVFIEKSYGRFVYDHSLGRWYRWDHHYWKEDASNRVMAAIEEVVDEYSEEISRQEKERLVAEKARQTGKASQHEAKAKELFKRIRALQGVKRRENVLKLASADWSQRGCRSLAITGDEWDRDPMVLGCKNGVVDLATGDFRPGRPDDYIKTIAPTEWKGIEMPAPTWERFVKEIFDNDTVLIGYIQRLFGYAATGKVVEQIFPIFWGEGRNGKGTLFESIKYTLGEYAGPVEAELLLDHYRGRQSGAPTSDIIALRGKRLVWASETKEGRLLDIGRLKWLTGADTRVGRPPFGKHQITYMPTDTLFLLTNHKPHVSANDYATWERIHLVAFKHSFVDEPGKDFERKRDPELFDKLKGEASGILAWLVRGCLEWTYQGLNPPESVRAATREYQKDEDVIGHFIAERCILRDDAEVKAGELYKAYQHWCEEMGHRPLSGTRFGKEMKIRFRSHQPRNVQYLGIGLLRDDTPHNGG